MVKVRGGGSLLIHVVALLSGEYLKNHNEDSRSPSFFILILNIPVALVCGPSVVVKKADFPAGTIKKRADHFGPPVCILHIKIQTHLIGVRPVADGVIFRVAFVVDPLLDHLCAEDVTFGEESMVSFQSV